MYNTFCHENGIAWLTTARFTMDLAGKQWQRSERVHELNSLPRRWFQVVWPALRAGSSQTEQTEQRDYYSSSYIILVALGAPWIKVLCTVCFLVVLTLFWYQASTKFLQASRSYIPSIFYLHVPEIIGLIQEYPKLKCSHYRFCYGIMDFTGNA